MRWWGGRARAGTEGGGQYLLKLVVPFADVGDAIDERQEGCKAAGGGNVAPAHHAAVGDSFTRRHGEHGHVVVVLVIPEETMREDGAGGAKGACALPVTAA